MQRITNPDDLFFPVDTRPIFTRTGGFRPDREIPVSGKMAIVNSAKDEVLGVVGRNYRLVTNREAFAYARACARAAFPETTEDEWEFLAADATQSGSYCHIDLSHRTGKLDFNYVMVGEREEVPETYGPYIRVTNSYNAQRALRFTIGCFRKVCKNGMTHSDDLVSFTFPHTRNNIGSEIAFAVDHDRVRRMQQEFTEYFDVLRDHRLERRHGKELVKAVLAIREPSRVRDADEGAPSNAHQRDWFRLEGYVDALYAKYADRLGDNAYAVLQASTELASHPVENLCLRKDRHALQKLAGEWVADFRQRCQQEDFDLSKYLALETHDHEGRAATGRHSTPAG